MFQSVFPSLFYLPTYFAFLIFVSVSGCTGMSTGSCEESPVKSLCRTYRQSPWWTAKRSESFFVKSGSCRCYKDWWIYCTVRWCRMWSVIYTLIQCGCWRVAWCRAT